jgi:methyltransferase (TIGR00027 family)
MSESEPLVRNISDTARWAAVYRARETERSDALFRDPFARRLAGDRGEQIADGMPFSNKATWAWITRTVLFDRFITELIGQGVDTVVNLAAGLDARPYRMPLSPSLKWIEVDLPEILDYKESILAGEKPVCSLERVRLDLSNVDARRQLFIRLGANAKRALVITEGLLIYLSADEVASLARDLASISAFQNWVFELVSPGLMKKMTQSTGVILNQANAPFKFAPPEGPGFFEAHGWQIKEVRSLLKTAAQLKRLTLFMRLIALLPESNRKQGRTPWSGICLLTKK